MTALLLLTLGVASHSLAADKGVRAKLNKPAVNGSETVTLEFSTAAEALTFHIVTRTPELILARPDLGIQYHLQADMAGMLLAIPTE